MTPTDILTLWREGRAAKSETILALAYEHADINCRESGHPVCVKAPEHTFSTPDFDAALERLNQEDANGR